MKFMRSRNAIAAALVAPLLLMTAPAGLAQAARGEPVTLNFANADIEAVARTMAVITGRDVVVDPRVKGTMNLATERPVSPTTAFEQFSAALRLQGFAVVVSEGLYKVVPEAEAKLQTGTVATSIGGPSTLAGNQIVTQVFKLHHESAANVLPVLRPLIAPNNSINVSPGNNALVITDYADNLRRLARIVASLDVPNASDVEVIPLRHSIAADLVPLVQRLMDGGSATVGLPTAAGAPAAPGGDASFRTSLLADSRSNAIIVRAANPARLALVRSLVQKLDRAPLENGNGAAGNIYVVYLKNADAVRLATTLRAAIAAGNVNTLGQPGAAGSGAVPQPSTAVINQATSAASSAAGQSGMSSAATAPVDNANQPSVGGQIQADPSTNSLIITAPEPQYRQLRAVIDRLDSRRAQVLIESLIVEVNADKAAEFGVQWQSALGKEAAIGTNSSLGGQANILDLALGIAAAAATGSPSAITKPSTGLNIGIGRRTGGGYALGFIARFLSANGEGNVLSTPNLLTLDNEEAKIVVGQNVPFVTGQFTNTGAGTAQVNPFQTIERKDVGLTLRVRPQISETGTVKMTVFQEVSAVLPGTEAASNGPTTTKRSIESSVLVEDGSIIVLGGLLTDEYSSGQEKVPGLGDVPVVGNLFKSETRSRRKNNLMVFLRPTIVRDSLSGDAITADRYDMLRALQQSSQPASSAALNAVNAAPLLPALPDTRTPDPSRRIEGTRLIPPPLPPAQPVRSAPPSDWDPMRGAPAATDDPSTQRRLP
ncbi:type II secretion system secretin GspD [Xenophilus arseniciresistens]|uniref:Type II secretion system secretin GspD n=1 Tax=Xenophilus arseniciresistens TaxID=1283306 RepID=A0AAE3NAM9_9BURK|nr:type II secretion system secretin GspD [Xenophilus arseniciresistens]MDA7416787.1 type II secretion system secretin GspD [Xenophilus arseniciresistens]